MNKHERIESLDVMRGLAVMLIILMHAAIYNFANIHLLDFSNPPIVVVLMSFMGLWGGSFIIYSMIANALKAAERFQVKPSFDIFRYLLIAGVLYLAGHYLLNFVLGRWTIDFENNQPDLTMTAQFFRNMAFSLSQSSKIFEGSALATISLNLIILSILLFFLLRNGGINKPVRNYLVLGISAIAIMFLSFLRVPLYPVFTSEVESGNQLVAILLSFLLANPYPLLPYLAYGLVGIIIGLMIQQGKDRLLIRVMIPAGLIFLAFGLTGVMNLDKSISKPDYFWYFKTHFELGLFVLTCVFFRFFPGNNSLKLPLWNIVKWFSRVSLTIYLLETTVSELLHLAGLALFPAWNQTISGCLVFGATNVLFWALVLLLWRRINFRYSLEYFWILLFRVIGKQSSKLDF